MKKLIALICLGFAFVVSTPVFAGAQQDKMKGCNVEAKADGLKGDERKAFMSKCLKKDYVLKSDAAAPGGCISKNCLLKSDAAAPEAAPVQSAGGTQQDKMKTCNADAKAKALTGDERKAFMKTCLKK